MESGTKDQVEGTFHELKGKVNFGTLLLASLLVFPVP